MDKFILDACCGPRMMWFDKKQPNTVYMDIRSEEHKLSNGCTLIVKPDVVGDYRKTDFPDKKFKLIVWDPPHLKYRKHIQPDLVKKYGCLNPETWQYDLKKGFDELWRVLDDYGILIFKWTEPDIKADKILKIIDKEPLFGNRLKESTVWFTFMKIPSNSDTKPIEVTHE